MGRREFLGVLGGAAAWTVVARAQQLTMPVVGFLRSTSLALSQNLVSAFRRGLRETGFVEGENVAIEWRSAEDHPDRLPALVAELIQRPVAVIVGNVLSALAAKAATTTVPIVFATGADPIRDGLVASVNRPGGNVTGVVFISSVLGTKRLELLHQLVPKVSTIGMLVNPGSPNTDAEREDVQAAALAIGQKLIILDVHSVDGIEAAFATLVQRGAGAVYAGVGAFFNSHTDQVISLAARYALPTSYGRLNAVASGGLMSYATSQKEAYRQAGIYAGRILKGEKPGDLPVIQSTKFELALNLKTAKTLGLEIPSPLLALATEIIE